MENKKKSLEKELIHRLIFSQKKLKKRFLKQQIFYFMCNSSRRYQKKNSSWRHFALCLYIRNTWEHPLGASEFYMVDGFQSRASFRENKKSISKIRSYLEIIRTITPL